MTKPVAMTFPEAIQAIVDGHEVRRLAWKNKTYYAAVFGSRLCLHKPDGAWHWWLISDADLKATDWVINDTEWATPAGTSTSPDA